MSTSRERGGGSTLPTSSWELPMTLAQLRQFALRAGAERSDTGIIPCLPQHAFRTMSDQLGS